MTDDQVDTAKTCQVVKSKSGGFLSFNIDHNIYKGLLKMGYKQPTPIQRKVIPTILDGRDCVVMARTGSGKTASFLVPTLQRLRCRSSAVRALIISPTRELALQTSKFAKQIGKFSNLQVKCILGGSSMDSNFELMTLSRPDIVVATPGRLVHLAVEMNLKLDAVEVLVLDEADRLFEMGCADELREILCRLPSGGQRQTVIVSATLPKSLFDFIKSPLINCRHQGSLMLDPILVRLDVESQLSPTLTLSHFHLPTSEHKIPTLLYLINQIGVSMKTVVFCATRHQVEYLHLVLDRLSISHTYIYSKLDIDARIENLRCFKFGQKSLLLVTDLAARGLDMPFIKFVINFNFPAKPKLFIHRVGRVARNGQTGHAYSIIAGDELAYFCDLQRYLGFKKEEFIASKVKCKKDDGTKHNLLGKVPQCVLDQFTEQVDKVHRDSDEVLSMKRVADNGQKQYFRSRSSASKEGVREAALIFRSSIASVYPSSDESHIPMSVHPLFGEFTGEECVDRDALLAGMKRFRPSSTVLELNSRSAKSFGRNNRQLSASNLLKSSDSSRNVMYEKRKLHDKSISLFKAPSQFKDTSEVPIRQSSDQHSKVAHDDISSNDSKLRCVFQDFCQVSNVKYVKGAKMERDLTNYIQYQPPDDQIESCLAIDKSVGGSNFASSVQNAIIDFVPDERESMSSHPKVSSNKRILTPTWDRKKKRYIMKNDVPKKIKTESGVWIAASFKSNRFAKWKERSKVITTLNPESSDITPNTINSRLTCANVVKCRPDKTMKRSKSEIRRPEQVLKTRKVKARQQMQNRPKAMRRRKK